MNYTLNFSTANLHKIGVQFQTAETYAHFCVLLLQDGISFIPAGFKTVFLFQDITDLCGRSKEFISALQEEKAGSEKIRIIKNTEVTKREIPTPEQVDQLLDEFIARRKVFLCQFQNNNP